MLGEQRVISRIIEKDEQGWSLRKTARFLEGIGVSTKIGKKYRAQKPSGGFCSKIEDSNLK